MDSYQSNSFTETVRVPTNYVSLAIMAFRIFRNIGHFSPGHGQYSRGSLRFQVLGRALTHVFQAQKGRHFV
ncbi:hypothetical protein [Leptospira santarosai]|uniref:hypothetical protein n=1 Tax=Leptospira santarosai TaxID=28183 RepID=UPI0031FD6F14